jgi:hypothetical protein
MPPYRDFFSPCRAGRYSSVADSYNVIIGLPFLYQPLLTLA